jgi:hypothetical protein
MGIQFQELFSWVRRRKFVASLLVILTLAIGIIIGTLLPGHAQANRPQSSSGAAMLAIPDPVTLSNGFSAISKKIGPAVVNTSSTVSSIHPMMARKPSAALAPALSWTKKASSSPTIT